MEEALALAQKIATIGFGPLLVLVLIGSYFEVWVWGKQHRAVVADLVARLAKAEERGDKWQNVALDTAGVLKPMGEQLSRRPG